MCRQKRLAKQALSVEQSAQSAPSYLADSRYSPDDTAWETVVKKGNKGSKANSAAASKLLPAAAQPAAAAASQSLQPQHSGLSQTGRTASGVLPPLASHQQSGGVQQLAGGLATRAKSADPSNADGGFSGESVATGHGRKLSQDEDALSTRSSVVEHSVLQHHSKAEGAEPSAAAQEAAVRAGLPAPSAPAKPSNWAGLLKPPQHQQQQQQDWQHEEDASIHKVVVPIVSERAFPQLATAASLGLDNLTPLQQSASEFSLSFDRSQGLSQAPSEAEVPSVPGSPFASLSQAQRSLASNSSETTADGAAREQRSQVHIAQQLHANAAIWGTGLSAGTLGGIQLPQQSQIPVNPFQAASSASSSTAPLAAGLWDPQLTLQLPPTSAPPRPSQALLTKPAVKSMLPVNAQPFVPQARLSTSASQGQRLPFAPQDNQQLASQPQSAPLLPQHALPTASPFMQSHSFGRSQQLPSSAAGVHSSSSSSFDSLARPQQQQQSLSRGFDGNAALQQMQRQRLLQQQQSQQQQQQQTGLLPRQQQQQQQQQLADIWLHPSLGVQQNGLTSRPAGSHTSHQQPPGSKGKAAANGPFGAHQPPAPAFHHHQQQQQSPFLQQQYTGPHQQHQQGRGNGSHFGAASMHGIANGHLSSAGTQSEEDELLSGVFAKVWEDNQVCYALCMLSSLSV